MDGQPGPGEQADDPFAPIPPDEDDAGYVKEKTYWFTWKGKDFVAAIEEKKRNYYMAARNRGLIDRWIISYAFHHGATPDDLREIATQVVSFTGNELERVRFHINLTRSYNRHAAIMALGEQPYFKAKTINSDHRSLAQAEVKDKIVNGLYGRYYEKHDPEVAEGDGFAGACGTHTRWDFKGGDEVSKDVPVMEPDVDELTGEPKVESTTGEPILRQRVGQPQLELDDQGQPIFDEATGEPVMRPGEPLTHPKKVMSGAPYVTTVYPWSTYGETRAKGEELWRVIREIENKWNVIAQFGERFRDDVLRQDTKLDEYDFATLFRLEGVEVNSDDMLTVEHCYHQRCPAMPEGRYVVKCGDAILHDGPCPTREGIPYSEMKSSTFVETNFPYCDGWDLISLNMALNQCNSDELQNLSLFSRQSTYSWKGSTVTQNSLTKGVHYDLPPDSKPPGAIMLAQMPPTTEFKQFVLGMCDRMSGMNGTTRGEPESNVRSGEMAALLDSISIRYQSFRQQAARRYRVRNAQIVVDMISRYGETSFFVDVAGVEDRSFVQEFTKDDLQGVQRVDIDVASPLMQTMSGRMQWYMSLKDLPPQERAAAHEFVVSGDPDAFMGRDRSCEMLIRRENEKLIVDSEDVEVNATDNPWLHVPKHVAAIERLQASDSPDLEAIKRLRLHVLQHWSVYTMYAQPLVCNFLGFQPPPAIGPTPDSPMGNAAYQFQMQLQAGMPITPMPNEPGDSTMPTTGPNSPQAPGGGAGANDKTNEPNPNKPGPNQAGIPADHPSGVPMPAPSQPPQRAEQSLP